MTVEISKEDRERIRGFCTANIYDLVEQLDEMEEATKQVDESLTFLSLSLSSSDKKGDDSGFCHDDASMLDCNSSSSSSSSSGDRDDLFPFLRTIEPVEEKLLISGALKEQLKFHFKLSKEYKKCPEFERAMDFDESSSDKRLETFYKVLTYKEYDNDDDVENETRPQARVPYRRRCLFIKVCPVNAKNNNCK